MANLNGYLLNNSWILGLTIFRLAATVLAEITPSKNRGRFMAVLNLSLLLGMVFGVLMAVFFINNEVDSKDNNWRGLTLTVMIPATASILL